MITKIIGYKKKKKESCKLTREMMKLHISRTINLHIVVVSWRSLCFGRKYRMNKKKMTGACWHWHVNVATADREMLTRSRLTKLLNYAPSQKVSVKFATPSSLVQASIKHKHSSNLSAFSVLKLKLFEKRKNQTGS